MFVVSASAPTWRLNDKASFMATVPFVISKVPSPLLVTLAGVVAPMLLAFVNSAAILLYASVDVIEPAGAVVPAVPAVRVILSPVVKPVPPIVIPAYVPVSPATSGVLVVLPFLYHPLVFPAVPSL